MRKQQRPGVAGARRAAGMAWNAVLVGQRERRLRTQLHGSSECAGEGRARRPSRCAAAAQRAAWPRRWRRTSSRSAAATRRWRRTRASSSTRRAARQSTRERFGDAPAVVKARIARESRRGSVFFEMFDSSSSGSASASILNLRKWFENKSTPSSAQQARAGADERGVIALHVEVALGALGVREGRRRAEDEVVAVPLAREELRRRPLRTMVCGARGQPLSAKFSVGPVEIRVRQIDAHRRARAAGGGVDRGRAGVGEQVQERLAGGERLRSSRAGGGDRGTARCRGSRSG